MSESADKQGRKQTGRRTAPWSRLTLLVLFIVAALGIAALGRLYYDGQRAAIVAQTGTELTSIRDLKIAQIVHWRAGLLSDAASIANDPTNADEFATWLANPRDTRTVAVLRAWLSGMRAARGYAGALIMSPDGSRWVSSSGSVPTANQLSRAVSLARSSEATVTDLYVDGVTGKPRMDVVAPIRIGGTDKRAVVVLHSDPGEYLYPLIQGWPVPSSSSETLLLRRDGDRVVYLNDLRFKPDAALRFTLPVSNAGLLGVQAIFGDARVAEGVDYRGEQVIGAIGPVGESPWYIVAKVDRAEAYATVAATERTILLGVALLVLVVGLGLLAVWRQNAVASYRLRLESERETRLLSQQYDYLTRYANDAVVLADAELRVVQVNDRAESMYGYSRDELLGMSLPQLHDPVDPADPLDIRLARSEGVSIFETRHVSKSGAVLDVEVSARSILADGRTLYLAIIRDITERKREEAEEYQRQMRSQAVLDNAPYGAHMYKLMPDDRLVFTGYNVRAVEMLGIDHEELLGKTLEEAFPGNVGTETPDAYRRVARDGGTWSTDQVAYSDGGIAGAFEVYAFSFGPNLVSVFFRDVTELRRSEAELRRTSAYLESLIDYANAPIIVWDPELRITRFNHAFERLTGRMADEVVGRPLELLFPPDSREGSLAKIARAVQGESWEGVEIPILRTDGEVRIALWNSANIYDAERDGELSAVIAQGQDITERKRAEQALEERTQDLQRSNAELEKFAYVASHDLQEPLRMVASYTQLLQKRYQGQLDADADEFIGYAVDGATRMRTLINELLAYSRVGTQGSPLVSTDLESVLDGVLHVLAPAIEDAGASVVREPMPTVVCDPVQIGQVLQNLIANAAKFHGAEPPLIHVGARREGADWVFSVKDNGIGIEPVYFDRVFVIFQRLESRAQYSGTGMGLAICKRIIERHGGRIWVESEPGSGSTFYFTLHAEREES